jgi:hypothetical protein
MKVKRQIVFISGKYRSKYGIIGRAVNIIKAYRAGRRLVKQGYSCYIPHMNTALMDGLQDEDWFLEATLKMLKHCQAVYMMSGWQSSIGACLELHEAKKRGIEVWYEDIDDTLPDAARRCIEAQIDMNPNWGKLEPCTGPVNMKLEPKEENNE